MQSKFENVQGAYMALAEFESESSLGALRSKVGAFWRKKQGGGGAALLTRIYSKSDQDLQKI